MSKATKTAQAAAKAAAGAKDTAISSDDKKAETAAPMTPGASGAADAGAATAAAPADAQDEARRAPPKGGKAQYVAAWELRRDRKRYRAGADLPPLPEDEAKSLLTLGAIRLK